MQRNLETRVLRTFVTVVDHGGFGRAAEALHITQSAVSQQVRQLNEQIGTRLFTSTKAPLRLSATGEELLGYARRILSLNDDAVARLLSGKHDGDLLFGMSEQCAAALPDISVGLARRLPGSSVRFTMALSEPLAAKVRRGEVDAALVLRPVRDTARETPLGEAALSWYGNGSLVSGPSLPVALFTEPCNLRSHVFDLLKSSGTAWHTAYEGKELTGLLETARSSLGLVCLLSDDGRHGLPRLPEGLLPEPGSLPLSLVVRPGLPPDVVAAVRASVRRSLRHLPLSAPH
ncbi:LysR family transcriptional regulator [Streptomyces sp. NPDC001904]|uniref:LysR family transcriptional regulator n=1 Tax=Streptomyces sp. NPDC001904 TaxID=3154531 RepID=UPI00331FBBB6